MIGMSKFCLICHQTHHHHHYGVLLQLYYGHIVTLGAPRLLTFCYYLQSCACSADVDAGGLGVSERYCLVWLQGCWSSDSVDCSQFC